MNVEIMANVYNMVKLSSLSTSGRNNCENLRSSTQNVADVIINLLFSKCHNQCKTPQTLI